MSSPAPLQLPSTQLLQRGCFCSTPSGKHVTVTGSQQLHPTLPMSSLVAACFQQGTSSRTAFLGTQRMASSEFQGQVSSKFFQHVSTVISLSSRVRVTMPSPSRSGSWPWRGIFPGHSMVTPGGVPGLMHATSRFSAVCFTSYPASLSSLQTQL